MHLFKQHAVRDVAARIPIIDFGPYFAGNTDALKGDRQAVAKDQRAVNQDKRDLRADRRDRRQDVREKASQ